MTDSVLADISFETLIDAPRDVVWRNMTSAETVPQWLGCMRYEAKIGHVFYMQQDPDKRQADDIAGATHCEVLTMEAPSLFRFSWYFPGTPKTEVTLQLTEVSSSQTRVHFTHSGWDQFDAQEIRTIRDALEGGWSSHVVPNLKRLSES